MENDIDNYNLPGDVPGGIVGKVENPYSHHIYFVSTIYQESDNCWTIIIGPHFLKISWFGLVKKKEPIPPLPALTFIRNTEKEAREVHMLVCKMVETHKLEDWAAVAPDQMPPDGFTEKMQRKLEATWGDSLTYEIRSKFRY
jgi:hypothetical protein